MRRRTRTALALVALVAASSLAACGGRPDGGNPGNPSADTTTSIVSSQPQGQG